MNDEITSYVADMYLLEKLKCEILAKIHELKYGLHKNEDDLVIVMNIKHYSLFLKYYVESDKWLNFDEKIETMFGVLVKQGYVERPGVGLR